MESVSPVRNFNAGEWRVEKKKSRSIMKTMFEVKKNRSCGSHIHVAPWRDKFTLKQAKTIAFACCYYDPYIISFMPEERRDHRYCQRNSKVSPKMSLPFENGDMAAIAKDTRKLSSTESLIDYMQGESTESRYFLWNFQPLANPRTGTIEFRGGRHARAKQDHQLDNISWLSSSCWL
ncbi:hypothetical protein AOL_s00109g103 [Orbilia oligospora ATCC 24927]|uniref:Uncharacterized protein n=1 Tax=Arthrobotrys oligospora (strain ATCC 24927 / CBS 115.81 / DSM 1491) TaxID=756982 RepID=G1XK74_ARTOA|nr:hypothetical protein AOL_s00109g103 [Orbilia oligospora ATCC 24927]EGX46531.1 hypothetical protein AOL_s00109g103 [Orbilia oligospora ATCC 24927]